MKKKDFSGRWIDHRFQTKAVNEVVAYSLVYDQLRFGLGVPHWEITAHLQVKEVDHDTRPGQF